jgi:DNA-binding Lrp family transcriptional regulator
MDLRVAPPVPRPSTVRVDEADRRVLAAIQDGLPLVSRPYAAIGARLGLSEAEVIARLDRLQQSGVIRRFGVVVRHREVGYGANAMVVWDAPDESVAGLGRCLAQFDFITLCYRRPRRLPHWRYNLYCMIHGRDREQVRAQLEWMINHCGLQALPHAVLFSRRRFKQRGARYFDVQGRTNAGTAQDARLVPADVQGRTNADAAQDARLAPAQEAINGRA